MFDDVMDAWLVEQAEFDECDDEFFLRDEWLDAQADAMIDYAFEDPDYRAAWFDYTDEEGV
jgi:hypothetical protein